MTVTKNIIDKIISEAEGRAAIITQNAKQEASAHANQLNEGIREMVDGILAEAKASAAARYDRILAAKELEGRKAILALKQQIVADAFDAAVSYLARLPDDQYNAVIGRMTDGLDGEIILLPRDAKAGTGGGFICKRGSVELNCSFAALAAANREKLEKDVVDRLFKA